MLADHRASQVEGLAVSKIVNTYIMFFSARVTNILGRTNLTCKLS